MMIERDLIKNLENAHGRKFIKLAEVECKIMRTEAKLELSRTRGIEDIHLADLIQRLQSSQRAITDDLAICLAALNDLRPEIVEVARMAHSLDDKPAKQLNLFD